MACASCSQHATIDPGLGQLLPRDPEGRIMIVGFTLEELAGIATVALAAITLWQVTRRW